jgi:hypothetical protein
LGAVGVDGSYFEASGRNTTLPSGSFLDGKLYSSKWFKSVSFMKVEKTGNWLAIEKVT